MQESCLSCKSLYENASVIPQRTVNLQREGEKFRFGCSSRNACKFYAPTHIFCSQESIRVVSSIIKNKENDIFSPKEHNIALYIYKCAIEFALYRYGVPVGKYIHDCKYKYASTFRELFKTVTLKIPGICVVKFIRLTTSTGAFTHYIYLFTV